MGWASWNSFAAQITAQVIEGQVDALAKSRMKTAGYQYVNIDEGWWQGTRDGSGSITVDESDWHRECAHVWTATHLGAQTTSYSATVPAEESVLLLVAGGA
jgi:hypothetical protein